MPDQPSEQPVGTVADIRRVRRRDWRLGVGHEQPDLFGDHEVFLGERIDGVRQAKVTGQDRLVQAVGTLGDLDVVDEVLGELDERRVHTLTPDHRAF